MISASEFLHCPLSVCLSVCLSVFSSACPFLDSPVRFRTLSSELWRFRSILDCCVCFVSVASVYSLIDLVIVLLIRFAISGKDDEWSTALGNNKNNTSVISVASTKRKTQVGRSQNLSVVPIFYLLFLMSVIVPLLKDCHCISLSSRPCMAILFILLLLFHLRSFLLLLLLRLLLNCSLNFPVFHYTPFLVSCRFVFLLFPTFA